jgi:hypothetical protein
MWQPLTWLTFLVLAGAAFHLYYARRRAWPEVQHSPAQRTLLSVQAKKWEDEVFGYSGVLEQ